MDTNSEIIVQPLHSWVYSKYCATIEHNNIGR